MDVEIGFWVVKLTMLILPPKHNKLWKNVWAD